MSAGMVPSEPVRENTFQASLLGSGGWLIIFGVPWLVKHHPDLCLHLHMAFSSLGPNFCLIKTPVIALGPTLI